MPRRAVYGEPMDVYRLRLRKDTIARLAEIPNGSERARAAIERDLELFDDKVLTAQIRQEQREIESLKDRVREREKHLTDLQALKLESQDRKSLQHEARLKFLESTLDHPGQKWEHWLDSRVDVMNDCGFKSVEDAVACIAEYQAKAVR